MGKSKLKGTCSKKKRVEINFKIFFGKSMQATPKFSSLKYHDELYAYRLTKCKNGEKETIVMAIALQNPTADVFAFPLYYTKNMTGGESFFIRKQKKP